MHSGCGRGLGTFADNWSHSPVFRGCHANRAEFLENPVIPICSGASRYDVFRGRPARRSQFLGRCGSWMNSKGEATGKTDKRARSQHGQKTSFEAEDRDDGWPRLPIWRARYHLTTLRHCRSEGIVTCSLRTGRTGQWQMRDATRREEPGGYGTRWWSIILPQCAWALIGIGGDDDRQARRSALSGKRGSDAGSAPLVCRWRADLDLLRQPYASAAKTRVFIDFVVEAFQREKWPERFAGSMG